MNSEEIHRRIREFSNIRKDAQNDEAALLEVALFVEDVFGILLSDEDICERNLGTHQATEQFVRNRLKTIKEKNQG